MATTYYYVSATNQNLTYRQLQAKVKENWLYSDNIRLNSKAAVLVEWLNDRLEATEPEGLKEWSEIEEEAAAAEEIVEETETDTATTVTTVSGASVNTTVSSEGNRLMEAENRIGFDVNHAVLSKAFPFLRVTTSNWQRLLSVYNSPEAYRSVCKAVRQPVYQPGRQGNQADYTKSTAYKEKNKAWNAARLEEQRKGLSVRHPLTGR